VWYSYAIVRVVPRVERGEFVNVGVVLFAREQGFLGARFALDFERLRMLAPDVEIETIDRHLRTFQAICAGEAAGGPIAAMPASERFHWLVAPRSTVIQTSPVHPGRSEAPEGALEELMTELVLPAPRPVAASQAEGA
jgi:hypothetical protein